MTFKDGMKVCLFMLLLFQYMKAYSIMELYVLSKETPELVNETSVLTNEILLLSNETPALSNETPVLTNVTRYYPTKQGVGSNFQKETRECAFRSIFGRLNRLVLSEGLLYNLFCSNKL